MAPMHSFDPHGREGVDKLKRMHSYTTGTFLYPSLTDVEGHFHWTFDRPAAEWTMHFEKQIDVDSCSSEGILYSLM